MSGSEAAGPGRARMAGTLADLAAAGSRCPALALVRVGRRADDLAYESAILKRAEQLGFRAEVKEMKATCSQAELEAQLAGLSDRADIDGILLLRPLPAQLDKAAAAACIDPQKDVDGMTAAQQARLYSGQTPYFAPCTAEAVVALLDHYGIDPAGLRAAVLGRSPVVGLPVALLLQARQATVTVCHSKTKNREQLLQQSDLVIAAMGRAKSLRAAELKPGCVVVDCGVSPDPADPGQLAGDLDPAAVTDTPCKISALAPLRGGVGALTTTILLQHTLEAYLARQAQPPAFLGLSLTDYLRRLSNAAAVPGGGSAAAYVAALGLALAHMAGSLAKAPKDPAEPGAALLQADLRQAQALQLRLSRLADEDARAFLPVTAAYRLPAATPEQKQARSQAIQAALRAASAVPLELARTAVDGLKLTRHLTTAGSRNAVTDAACAGELLLAAVRCARLNTLINARQLRRQAESGRDMERRADLALEEASRLNQEIQTLADGLMPPPLTAD
ncbi:hypothetical protein HCH52_04085 [Oscillospiraceae bacterium HV4-5-C5C]|nr:hypothetical protein [Oscillospiraceae bacterium HV4-5-C5C]